MLRLGCCSPHPLLKFFARRLTPSPGFVSVGLSPHLSQRSSSLAKILPHYYLETLSPGLGSDCE